MSEGIFTIELGEYGFMLDTEWLYVALSWQILITVGVISIAYVAYKKWSNRK
jgi:hypothetical protein